MHAVARARSCLQVLYHLAACFFKIAAGYFPQSRLGIIVWLAGAVEGQLEVGPASRCRRPEGGATNAGERLL